MGIYVYENDRLNGIMSMTENDFKEKYKLLLEFTREYGKPIPDTTKKKIEELEKDVKEYIEDIRNKKNKSINIGLGFMFASYLSAFIITGFVPLLGLLLTLITSLISIIQTIKTQKYNNKLVELKEDLKRVKGRVHDRKDLDRLDNMINKIDDILFNRY